MNIESRISSTIVDNLEAKIESVLNRCGIYYRIFGRLKDSRSIEEKIKRKGYPTASGGIMQDLIGIRIALYFVDDVYICKNIIENLFQVVNRSISQTGTSDFSAERLNLVCSIPEKLLDQISPEIWTDYPIDKTFEIQIRTVFSEGWHEIEHDVRYKSDVSWNEHKDLSRNLNGILATLETCDWSIVEILNNMAYREYKNHRWASMLKTKFRVHLIDSHLDDHIAEIFNKDPDIAKSFFRIDREALLEFLAYELKLTIPLKLDNVVYLVNRKWIHCSMIDDITPTLIQKYI